jgi:DNA (cytosine-5)-methyltransferase 1
MTTQCTGLGNGRFGHPEQDRAISLREAALIQTFPNYYQFVPEDSDVISGHISKFIGNAVPVRLGAIIAKSIKAHLNNYVSSNYR